MNLSSYSQVSAPCENAITDEQVKKIYIGLKQGNEYKKRLSECLQASNKLNDIVINQDQELQKSIVYIRKLNEEQQKLNNEITASKVEIQRLESKKIPIWKHPIVYFIAGIISGVFIAK